jgi:phosphoribosylanthranilate isomerase
MSDLKVKICGITNIEDAIVACKFGVDALGFIFYKKSPRYIELSLAKEIIKELPPFIKTVGVFVNVKAKEINSIAKESNIDLAQIHFVPDSDDFYDDLEVSYIDVIRAKSIDDIKNIDSKFHLVDSFVESYGGCGKKINLDWFIGVDKSKIVLAGGINTENISEIKKYGFYGVDVCSGVEKSHGIKDYKLLEEFLGKVRT